MAEMVTIQNMTDIAQPAYLNERRVMLNPYEIRDVAADVATAFVTQRPGRVQIYKPVVVPVRAGESVRWLANVTGSPFAPKELVRMKMNQKTNMEEEYRIPNPNVRPVPVTREIQTDQTIQDATQGPFKESISYPPVRVTIPPYTRYPFPVSVAEWMMRRDAQMDENSIGQIMACRAPSAFEPNDSWTHGEILVYARMVDPAVQWGSMFKAGKPGNAEDQDVKKMALLHAFFFRLVDENYALPPEAAFHAELGSVKEEMYREKEANKSASAQPSA